MIREAIVKIVNKGDLTYEEAYAVRNERMSGETTPTQNAALLAALPTKSARPDATEAEILQAAQLAQCGDILEKTPGGLDAVIGAKGVYLSGGEMQRIALARAILKDAPIVVLDEASSFADPENEAKIQKAFEALMKGKTVLMIAHRLSTVRNMDRILVIRDGEIAEEGKHDELLEKGGVYAAMWEEYQKAAQWKVGGAA